MLTQLRLVNAAQQCLHDSAYVTLISNAYLRSAMPRNAVCNYRLHYAIDNYNILKVPQHSRYKDRDIEANRGQKGCH